jgi:hypothetical protein
VTEVTPVMYGLKTACNGICKLKRVHMNLPYSMHSHGYRFWQVRMMDPRMDVLFLLRICLGYPGIPGRAGGSFDVKLSHYLFVNL